MGRLKFVFVPLLILFPMFGTHQGATGASSLRSVTLAISYIPDVQFAPFYVAAVKGYYREAGLDVHFRYGGLGPDLLRLASQGKVDFVNASGDEVLTAGGRGFRVKYVLTQFSHFPAAVFSLRRMGIHRPADLQGHSVGIPFPFGANYVGLLALLSKAHLSASDVAIKSIGFTQVQSVAHGQVDAAVGYANNEPVELRQSGYRIREFDIYRSADLAGAGIATGDTEIAHHPRVVRAFVRATLRGLRDTLRNPDQAFGIALGVVKIKSKVGIQRAKLRRSLDFWQAEPGHPLGWVDPRIWKLTGRLLYQFRQIPRPVSATHFYTNRFVPRS